MSTMDELAHKYLNEAHDMRHKIMNAQLHLNRVAYAESLEEAKRLVLLALEKLS